jgi:hypothetical protein
VVSLRSLKNSCCRDSVSWLLLHAVRTAQNATLSNLTLVMRLVLAPNSRTNSHAFPARNEFATTAFQFTSERSKQFVS